MLAPTFLSVASETGCTLADLKVTGYSAPVYNETRKRWTGGTSGAFNLQILTSSGTTETTYKWYDNGTKTGWYDEAGTTKIEESSVALVAGKAFWCQTEGLTLVPAGAVNVLDVGFDTNASGFSAIGNPYPVTLDLNDLTVTGYSAPVYNESRKRWTGGTSGALNIQFLTSSGTTEATYKWYDNGTKTGWYDEAGTTKIENEAVSIPAGKGLWVQGEGLTINFPAPEL